MANSTITHENNSCLINILADKRGAVFDKVWAEGGRDFTPEEHWTLDLASRVLLRCVPETRADAGAVLETAIEQLQLSNHGDTDVSLEAVETALFKVLDVMVAKGDYELAIFQRAEGTAIMPPG